MKIVGFETDKGLGLGVVEGDPGDRPAGGRRQGAERPRRALLAANNGDLKPLGDHRQARAGLGAPAARRA